VRKRVVLARVTAGGDGGGVFPVLSAVFGGSSLSVLSVWWVWRETYKRSAAAAATATRATAAPRAPAPFERGASVE